MKDAAEIGLTIAASVIVFALLLVLIYFLGGV